MATMEKKVRSTIAAVAGLMLCGVAAAGSYAPAQTPAKPAATAAASAGRTTWFFYKVKWGSQDEFLDLFQRNHYPVLKARLDAGHYASIRTFTPTYHGDGRADWTFAVEIRFRSVETFVGPSGDDEITKQLYPDQAKFRKEEQRRFEILDAHWDVPLNDLSM